MPRNSISSLVVSTVRVIVGLKNGVSVALGVRLRVNVNVAVGVPVALGDTVSV